ncbi:hypothetical protein QIA37_05235 (plasmid) [Borrelia sp. CA_690]|uniref:hypothetical protein n=1 Tax=Borrelia TaxID=138 RepID=UPI001E516E8C|nr:hypothetical protein [Borrelia maritima]
MKNIFDYLRFNAIEICVLKDMKRVIYKFYESPDIENDVDFISLASSLKSQNIFTEFF